MRIGNWTLLFRAIEHIITHPDEHDQTTWRLRRPCGTVRCIAGWIAHFGGWTDTAHNPEDSMHGPFRVAHPALDGDRTIRRAALISLDLDPGIFGDQTLLPLPDTYELESAAAHNLANSLFDGDLDFEEILENVYHLAAKDGVTLTPVIQREMQRRDLVCQES